MSETLDNSHIVLPFMPADDDGDTFLYTELLDRAKKDGPSSRARPVQTYYHRSRAQFEKQLPTIRHVAEATGARAYTRLSPRSLKAVGKLCARIMFDRVLEERWDLMRHAYASACGRVTPLRKYWLFDIDEETDLTRTFGAWLGDEGYLTATVPSRRGVHYVVKPFDPRKVDNLFAHGWGPTCTLHKDNPTNLYIPAGAV